MQATIDRLFTKAQQLRDTSAILYERGQWKSGRLYSLEAQRLNARGRHLQWEQERKELGLDEDRWWEG